MSGKIQFKKEEFRTPKMCTIGGHYDDCVAVAINEHGVAVRSTHDKDENDPHL